MTMLTDLDRMLGTFLEVEGPQAVPPGLVDAALAEARAIEQRRPIIRVVDRLAWPSSSVRGRGWALAGALALLLLALLAALIGGPGRARPALDPLSDGRRVVYTDEATVVVVDAVGAQRFAVQAPRGGCLHLLPGDTVGTHVGYGEWPVIDVPSGRQVASLDTDYAGFERWSAGGDRLALVNLAGVATIATFDDPRAPSLTSYQLPGVQWLDFSRDGRRMAVAIADGSTLTIDVIDLESREQTTVYMVEASDLPPSAVEGSMAYLSWGSDADHVMLSRPDEATPAADLATWLIPLDGRPAMQVAATGGSVHVPSRDGQHTAVPDGLRGLDIVDSATGGATFVGAGPDGGWLGWSWDGTTLAFLQGGALRLVDAAGTNLRTVGTGVLAAAWIDGQPGIAIVRDVGADLAIDVLDPGNGAQRALVTIDDAEPTGTPCLSTDRLEEQ